MASFLSRRKLAEYATSQLLVGDGSIIDQLAGFLLDEGREREVELLIADIEELLAEKGQLILTVETAHKLDEKTKDQLERLFADRTVHFREIIKPELIGGFRLRTPTQFLDRTIAGDLNKLKAQKV